MTTNDALRVAVLGLGRMGWNGHFERLAGDPRFRVVAVADTIKATRARAREKCHCAAFADAAQVLAKLDELDVELVVNVLPSDLHVEFGLAALKARRHVVIDKPVAPDMAGVVRLIEAAAYAGKRLLAHHNRRFAKNAQYLRQVIETGAIGRVFQMTVNMASPFSRRNDWQTLQRMYGGLLRNHGTHWLDLALYLFGAPGSDVWGDAKLVTAAGDAEDHYKVVYRAPGGCLVELLGSTACAVKLPTVVLFGTHGTLTTDYRTTATLQTFDSRALPPLDVDLGVHDRYQGRAVPLQETRVDLNALLPTGDFYDNVFEVLRRGAAPGVPLDHLVEIHRIVDVVLSRKVSDWREEPLRPPKPARLPAPAQYRPAATQAQAAPKPEPFALSPEWVAKIRALTPERPTVAPRRARRALMISVCRGFQHWVTPHTAAVVKVLAERTGAFRVAETTDAMDFLPGRLADFDAVILNNTCPIHPRRAFFADYLADDALAERLKDSLIGWVERGGGIVAIHGGGLTYMNCPKWEAMQGATFAYHPAQQTVTLTPVEPGHPLVQAFGGEPFVHHDEPYLFASKYARPGYRPLLTMDPRNMSWRQDKEKPAGLCAVAWVRRHGKGRYFYCSPSHNAQSFEDTRLLRFLLDGIQYAMGDLPCEDTPAV
jgi:predicted dehydrogenase/type 1 glutamine amidotransferase